MRTVKAQDEPSTRSRFQYRPDRHYVLAEKESKDWDGSTLDGLLNETLEDGSDAYIVEADGGQSSENRRATGGSRMILLSCPKEYADAKVAQASRTSKTVAKSVAAPTDDEFEKLQELAAISLTDLPSAEELAKKRFAP